MSALKKIKQLFAPEPRYYSKFGGVWTDRLDAHDLLKKKPLSSALKEKLSFWIDNGYVVIENAVSHEVVDRLRADIDTAWATQDPRYKMTCPGHKGFLSLKDLSQSHPKTKLLDVYTYSQAAREVSFAEPIREFISAVFERDILAFQNLTFETGSQQGVHQDTAYTVVDSSLEFVASWVALEDIKEGAGELIFYPKSHRCPDFPFADNRKYFDPAKDSEEVRERYKASLQQYIKEQGLTLTSFCGKKGDAIIWAADLAHGGSQVTRPELTRKSYVTDYCPNNVNPYFFSYMPQRSKKLQVKKGCYICTSYYDLAE